MRRLLSLSDGLLEALFPSTCAACEDLGGEPFCALCAQAVEPGPRVSLAGGLSAQAAFVYGGPVALAIHRLKYQGRLELARPLGRVMRPIIPEGVDVLVPVPISNARRLERGYNQARELARALGLPVSPRALVRLPGPSGQVGLDRAGRLANLRGALAPGPQPVKGLAVLLVDDVITTGATAEACAEVLRASGARSVRAASLAYTAELD